MATASCASWGLIDLRCRSAANLEDRRERGRVHKPVAHENWRGILGRLHRQGARAVSPPEGQPRHKGTVSERQFLSRGRDSLAMRGREENHRGNQTLSLEAQAGPSASKARRYSFFPFSLRGDAPQPRTASEVVAPRSAAEVEAQTAPTEVRRPSHARRDRVAGRSLAVSAGWVEPARLYRGPDG
jgi:hypothetical protein